MFVSETKLKKSITKAKAVCFLSSGLLILTFVIDLVYFFINRYTPDIREITKILFITGIIVFAAAFKRYLFLNKVEVLKKYISLHIREELTVHSTAVFMKMPDKSFVIFFEKLVSKGYILNLDIINKNGTDEIIACFDTDTENVYIECSKCGLKNKIANGSDAKCTFCKSNLNS